LEILLVLEKLLKGGVEVIVRRRCRRWSRHVQSNESTSERSLIAMIRI
jgi:hypothetical protein